MTENNSAEEMADDERRRLSIEMTARRLVSRERRAQDREFGEQKHDPAYWLAILGKQYGQLGEAVLKRKWSMLAGDDRIGMSPDDCDQAVLHEAVQVAAVAQLLIIAVLSGDLVDEITTAVPRDPKLRAASLGIEEPNYGGDES